ncbi:MAG TPA: elongation factor P maturation arginine rhamnosyltransferase EarP [Burkholderiaceae bacterium]|jgi:uncharacterized repeat protein (TIGR03837 family)
MNWDLFCRVIDNYGDVGVAWRLSADLAARGESVRLWLDDASALAWMAPNGAAGVEVLPWAHMPDDMGDIGDVVIELFGCDLPDAILQRMAARPTPPRWINLEYLSAEPYVERSHGLTSPQFSGPARGLSKHFFYPGFTERTGGLLREPGLLTAEFDAQAWLAGQGIVRHSGERLVSLFAYPKADVAKLVALLADAPTLILACPGKFAQPPLPTNVRWQALPYLPQPGYDSLLRACDLNFVRGEDSFVRAQWAGKPFVWQIYPQDDGAQGPKLEAFLSLYDPDAATQALFRAWNGLGDWPSALPSLDTGPVLAWRAQLARQRDLATQLQGFVAVSG